MVELADTLDLGSSAERCAGSSPVPGTSFCLFNGEGIFGKLAGFLSDDSSQAGPAQLSLFSREGA